MSDSSLSPRAFFAKISYRVYLLPSVFAKQMALLSLLAVTLRDQARDRVPMSP